MTLLQQQESLCLRTATHTWSATLVAMKRQVNRMERRVAAVLSASSPVTLGGTSAGWGQVAEGSSRAGARTMHSACHTARWCDTGCVTCMPPNEANNQQKLSCG